MKRILLVLAIAAGAAAAAAQDDEPPPPPPWASEAGLSYVQTGGNTDTQTVGLAAQLVHTGRWSAEASGSLLRTESADTVTAKKWTGLLRGTRLVRPRLRVLAQASFVRDLFSGIEREVAFDGGVEVELLDGPRHTLASRLSVAGTNEHRIAPAGDRAFVGLRAGGTYRLAIGDGSELVAEASYLRGLDEPSASRARTTVSATSSLGRLLALKVAHKLVWLQSPVPGKKATDTELVASIVARWPPAD